LKHAVTLAAFTRPDDSESSLEQLKNYCQEILVVPIRRSNLANGYFLGKSVLTNQSFIIHRDDSRHMAAQVQGACQRQQFDAIHSDQLWMARYALHPVTGYRPLRVLDEHNACFQIFQRLARNAKNPLKRLFWEREWRLMRRYEGRACAQFDHVITVTQTDQEILQELAAEYQTNFPAARRAPHFQTIPICNDSDTVPPIKPRPGSLNILHLGTMFWLPNVEGVLWFGREVYPQVKASLPAASLTIAGKNPPQQVKALPEQTEGIDVTGYVPDPLPVLEKAGAFIVPLLSGGGMRVKIIDAWRWGLPVISTSIGAEGIDYIDGENILIADTPADFAKAVTCVLTDPALNLKLRENGRRWVKDHYDWQAVYRSWDSIYS
jgi:glycosyltransferase involved in cell wall biosynthesis